MATIYGSQPLGDWGKMTPTNQENVHITQTNKNAREGLGVHVTTDVPGTQGKTHDYFDSNGNFKRSDVGGR